MKKYSTLITLLIVHISMSTTSIAGHSNVSKSMSNQKKLTTLRVRLLGPLNTKTGKCGDEVVVQVVEPEEYKGDILEGVVTESKSGGSIKGKAELTFVFQNHVHNNQPIPIKATLKSISNSKGQEMVDEEGNVVKRENNLKSVIGKSILGGLAGAALGAVLAGGEGAAIGAAAGAGTAAVASIVYIKYKVKGADITFDTGSEMSVEVQDCENCKLFRPETCAPLPQVTSNKSSAIEVRPTLTRANQENRNPSTNSIQRPDKPSTKFRTYKQGSLFAINIPKNWRLVPDGDNLAFAPNGGYLMQGANVEVEYGVKMGIAQLQSQTVESGIEFLITSLIETSKNSEKIGKPLFTGIAGREFLTARIRGESAAPNRMNIVDIYLSKLNNGSFVYFITSVPEKDYPEYLEAFLTIRSSIQIHE
jgi:outer membrane lipoprotein SlyB